MSNVKIPRWQDLVPTVSDLAMARTSPMSLSSQDVGEGPRRHRGLFFDLLHGRPEHLIQDARSNKVYPEEDLMLLHQIYQNQKKVEELTAEEAERLNKVTAEFFASKPGPVAPSSAKRHVIPGSQKPKGASEEAPFDPSDPFNWLGG